ncbi:MULTISPECIES: SMI1/KNR4 family protein [unclassified Bacillus (in: firmicutes)]|uniref:SMI1/KNR4 family protein n=1 Tax=unclassified Bacillus (in: firmicutes) TaxID=185979 RepID=UPI0008E29B2E|nr:MULTISPECIES: SMI1/KNR4 family protein [unclassified Bacillus (in: firmicutes)]SFA99813.1 SMI1 / KNR4 family (SUKH-1) [Bacillus sp. UNCCL13]SFQ81811.1 SMI1 / KNR4 family (SUKH-1) [Bacillus sp. cl95]
MSNNFKEIVNELDKWKQTGERVLENGTILICKVPHIAPEAWFHIIYPQIGTTAINEIEKELSVSLPEDFKEILLITNGLNIFSDSLSIYGKRNSYVREGDEAIQPYDLVLHHSEVKQFIPDNLLVIGSYNWDGSYIIYDIKTNQIHRCENYSSKVLNSWANLKTFLSDEIKRLAALFDENGIEYDENVPTTP